ncbi:hypothetical protein F9L00_21480 [Brucella anthropi]|uniref:hypothetical protein n=1 Tax=Brucella/Ochrobactrum group TaxID=2826938 RepID=UPI00124CA39B|nr:MULTISPECIES: hypothetical protein [Brucella/Ochrobactrum group]KAB2774424.1 hypothetical protein F9L00_21480 [Brucella anthropi]MCQ9148344.1 hypothetical protein [Ochrobactrum sp. BTU2]
MTGNDHVPTEDSLSLEDKILARFSAIERLLSVIAGREMFKDPQLRTFTETSLKRSEKLTDKDGDAYISDPLLLQVEKDFQAILRSSLEIARPVIAKRGVD